MLLVVVSQRVVYCGVITVYMHKRTKGGRRLYEPNGPKDRHTQSAVQVLSLVRRDRLHNAAAAAAVTTISLALSVSSILAVAK